MGWGLSWDESWGLIPKADEEIRICIQVPLSNPLGLGKTGNQKSKEAGGGRDA